MDVIVDLGNTSNMFMDCLGFGLNFKDSGRKSGFVGQDFFWVFMIWVEMLGLGLNLWFEGQDLFGNFMLRVDILGFGLNLLFCGSGFVLGFYDLG